MTNEFLAFAPISTAPAVDPARALLDEMMARVGVDGLAAALGDTGLLAQVDQHAAAVRDALHHAGREADAEGLAAEWHLLRLVAVCMIAESSGLL